MTKDFPYSSRQRSYSRRAVFGRGVARWPVTAATPSRRRLFLGALALGEIHAELPPRLIRTGRQPAAPEVVEIWFAA
jgi:hypothetical protein